MERVRSVKRMQQMEGVKRVDRNKKGEKCGKHGNPGRVKEGCTDEGRENIALEKHALVLRALP